MTELEMIGKIRKLRELEALFAEANEEIEALKDAIKSEMGDREELRAGEYKVSWKNVESNRLDSTALKKALPEIAERFMKKTVTRRFLVA